MRGRLTGLESEAGAIRRRTSALRVDVCAGIGGGRRAEGEGGRLKWRCRSGDRAALLLFRDARPTGRFRARCFHFV